MPHGRRQYIYKSERYDGIERLKIKENKKQNDEEENMDNRSTDRGDS